MIDTSETGREAYIDGLKTIFFWSSMEKTQYINILKLKMTYLALLAFTDNVSAMIYLLEITKISKEIWIYLLIRNILIGEYLPSKLNYAAHNSLSKRQIPRTGS